MGPESFVSLQSCLSLSSCIVIRGGRAFNEDISIASFLVTFNLIDGYEIEIESTHIKIV
jgi:hypothetical protein